LSLPLQCGDHCEGHIADPDRPSDAGVSTKELLQDDRADDGDFGAEISQSAGSADRRRSPLPSCGSAVLAQAS